MQYIDEKFKDENPEVTVNKIIEKLNSLGIKLNEKWNDSKIENCCSLRISIDGGIPGTNGKGVTKELARASAYGEFMERIQSGLNFYKLQSFENDESVYLHAFAPDKKYVTRDELLADSDWMEPICKEFAITKEKIADACVIFNCSDKIITLPYYSLFEDKYVYLPQFFVEHIFGANGCCVGNTREEAWVHALSEVFERNSSMAVLKSGKPVPEIPREKLKNFKVVNKILDRIEVEGIFDVKVFDYSCGKKFPVIATRIVNKNTKGYIVNVGADPVFEIAVERTLTEIFQGRNLDNFTSRHSGRILTNLNEIKTVDNVFNQVETGDGLFTVDFFAGTDQKDDTDSFPDNSDKNNKQLLKWILEKYRELGLNVYVRNNSFLGVHCYKFLVPGYSDIKGERLKAPILDYYFADRAAKVMRDVKGATVEQLSELLMYRRMIDGFISKSRSFNYLSGLPIEGGNAVYLSYLHFAYASLRCKNFNDAISYISKAMEYCGDGDMAEYFSAIKLWMSFAARGVENDKILKLIKTFYKKETYDKFKKNLENDALLDEYLIECKGDCANCKHNYRCNYERIRKLIATVGKEYAKFTDGQDKKNFQFDF